MGKFQEDDLKITVGIPSVGRASILHDTLVNLSHQTEQPAAILVSVADPSDLLPATADLPLVRVLHGPRGSAVQRNTILDNLESDDGLIAFFDDDVELDPDYLRNAVAFMSAHPEVAAFCGYALANGFEVGEIPRGDALRLLTGTPAPNPEWVRGREGLYGCNMVIRSSIARAVRFDNRLALYAMFEDVDFGERCRAYGQLVTYSGCRMVHLATRSGRSSPERFGYAQITNPAYLLRKGSVPRPYLIKLLRNVIVANLVGLVIVYRHQPRRARLRRIKGNLLALRDILLGGPRPERILQVVSSERV